MTTVGVHPVGAGRARLRSAVAPVLLALLTAALSVGGAASSATASEADTLHALVNDTRAANGLGALNGNGAMDAVALAWANQLAVNGTLSHNPSFSDQIPGGWSAAGENVAQGYPDAYSMHDGWIHSSGHLANILGDYTDVGIAFVSAGGTTWGVEVFARYGASVAPLAPVAPPADPAEAAPVAVTEATAAAPLAAAGAAGAGAVTSAGPVKADSLDRSNPSNAAGSATAAAKIADRYSADTRAAGDPSTSGRAKVAANARAVVVPSSPATSGSLPAAMLLALLVVIAALPRDKPSPSSRKPR